MKAIGVEFNVYLTVGASPMGNLLDKGDPQM